MTTILPPPAADIERRLDEAAEARLGSIDFPLPDMWDPARIPAAWLPVLGWAMSADDWVASESEAAKRARVAAAARAHERKGTEQGIRDLLSSFGAIYDYRESGPFRAEIAIHNTGSLLTSYADLVGRIETTKRASVHLSWVADGGTCQTVAIAIGVGAVPVSPPVLLTLEAAS